MKSDPRILIASAGLADAELVARLLRQEFDQIAVSTAPELAVADFEKFRPEVLILAFNDLEKAERYYLGMYRLSKAIHECPHRTVILCNKDELRRVYELCKRDYFDDYVLFWPIGNDATRLLLATHHAARRASPGAEMVADAELRDRARQLADLDAALQRQLLQGSERLVEADRAWQGAGQQVHAAVDKLAARLVAPGADAPVSVRDPAGLRRAFDQLKHDDIGPPLAQASAAAGSLRRWIDELPAELAPQLESARVLGALARTLQPLVLLVDDDDFQHRLVRQMLKGSGIELACVQSAAEALAGLSQRPPALVLMDINLPGMNGVELTRRIKAMPALARVPVVMLTGEHSKHAVLDSRQAGAIDFLAKPFEKEVLLGKIRRYLGEASADAVDNAPEALP